MGLANYDELKQSIIDWSHRDDLDLKIDDFIRLAEVSMFSNPDEILNIREGEQRATASLDTSSRYLALPSGFVKMRKFSRIEPSTGKRQQLFFRTPSQLHATDDEGYPCRFAITSQIEFDVTPIDEDTVEMQYTAEFTPLSSSNQTNFVLADHPDVYLNGSLWALKTHIEEDQQAANYYALFLAAIRGANKKAKAGRYGPRPRMIPRGSKP